MLICTYENNGTDRFKQILSQTFKYCVKGFKDIQQEVVKTGKLFIKKSKKAFTIVKRNKKGEIEGTFPT